MQNKFKFNNTVAFIIVLVFLAIVFYAGVLSFKKEGENGDIQVDDMGTLFDTYTNNEFAFEISFPKTYTLYLSDGEELPTTCQVIREQADGTQYLSTEDMNYIAKEEDTFSLSFRDYTYEGESDTFSGGIGYQFDSKCQVLGLVNVKAWKKSPAFGNLDEHIDQFLKAAEEDFVGAAAGGYAERGVEDINGVAVPFLKRVETSVVGNTSITYYFEQKGFVYELSYSYEQSALDAEGEFEKYFAHQLYDFNIQRDIVRSFRVVPNFVEYFTFPKNLTPNIDDSYVATGNDVSSSSCPLYKYITLEDKKGKQIYFEAESPRYPAIELWFRRANCSPEVQQGLSPQQMELEQELQNYDLGGVMKSALIATLRVGGNEDGNWEDLCETTWIESTNPLVISSKHCKVDGGIIIMSIKTIPVGKDVFATFTYPEQSFSDQQINSIIKTYAK